LMGPDTACDTSECGTNEMVVNHLCTDCPAGKTSTGEHDVMGPDTTCDATTCGANEKVVNHFCAPCPADTTSSGDHDASGDDTTCDAGNPPTVTEAPVTNPPLDMRTTAAPAAPVTAAPVTTTRITDWIIMPKGSHEYDIAKVVIGVTTNSLKVRCSAGTEVLPVVSNSDFEIGEAVVIDAGTPIEEVNRIVGFGSLLLESPLKFDHGPGALINAARSSSKGGTASLDAAGFLATTSLCCPVEMEMFFNRLLDKMGQAVCSKPHIQGLMHWFHCVPNMDFQYMVQLINDGNPCKYWAPKGQDCPVLSPECAGHYCR